MNLFFVLAQNALIDLSHHQLSNKNLLEILKDENDVIILPFDKRGKTEENALDNIDDSKATAIHPAHYRQGKYEPIDVISDWNLNFNLGNTIKYIARAEYKGNKKEDLEKAAYYLNDELDRLV